jgi:hypothetical protein
MSGGLDVALRVLRNENLSDRFTERCRINTHEMELPHQLECVARNP